MKTLIEYEEELEREQFMYKLDREYCEMWFDWYYDRS
jgi:hypothetical protein